MIESIQLLRAIAASSVIFVHLELLLGNLGLPKFGGGGVDLFFVISGFIMVHTTRDPAVTAARFARNRVARVAPIYWLITLLVFGLALAMPGLMQGTRAELPDLLRSLAFIPYQRGDGAVLPVLFVGWTLNYEMFFYAIFAVGLLVADRARGRLLVIGALVALVLAGAVLQPTQVQAAFYTSPVMLEFALGMGLAIWLPRMRAPLGRPARTLWLAGFFGGTLACILLPLAFPELPGLLTAGLAATLAVAAALKLELSGVRLRSRLGRSLGDASYAIYLTHPFVTQVAQKLGAVLGGGPLVSAALILLGLGGALVFGVLVHRLVEKPLSQVARSLLARPLPVPQLAPR